MEEDKRPEAESQAPTRTRIFSPFFHRTEGSPPLSANS